MKALILENGKLSEKNIGNELEDLQEIVGGYIEIPFLGDVFAENDIDVVINEEGKLIDGMKPEIAIINNGDIIDVVYGNCIFVSHDDCGDTIGLNDEQINIVMNELQMEVMITEKNIMNKHIVKALFV